MKDLEKAMWEMLNYSNMFVVLLDEKLNIKLINWKLATSLGFKNENEPIGRCWLDFIPESKRVVIRHIHRSVVNGDPKFTEALTDLIIADDQIVSVRWFNCHINHDLKWTFSIGVPVTPITIEMNIDSMRAYFQDIIQKDATMIKAIRDVASNPISEDVCNITESSIK